MLPAAILLAGWPDHVRRGTGGRTPDRCCAHPTRVLRGGRGRAPELIRECSRVVQRHLASRLAASYVTRLQVPADSGLPSPQSSPVMGDRPATPTARTRPGPFGSARIQPHPCSTPTAGRHEPDNLDVVHTAASFFPGHGGERGDLLCPPGRAGQHGRGCLSRAALRARYGRQRLVTLRDDS